ncbi:energy transducer TonB [Mucilaginibacter terrae]|uniref:energy transducer TonB n=1 Tax=Mucilaginibacter terrae TaxID=1955052 RepID=UPI0036456674
MSNEISNIKLRFSCNENWDAMTGSDGGKYCDKCQKKVYDFTNSKADEFMKILAENNYSICGRFAKQQVYVEPMIAPLWKKWLSAAMVLIGFSLFTNNAVAQKVKHKQAKHKVNSPKPTVSMGDVVVPATNTDTAKVVANPNSNEIFGGVDEFPPEFPGGNEKLYAFIAKNLDQSKSFKPGRVNITFIVEKDGSLSNIQSVGRHFDEGAEKEAMRVIALSPKWIPGNQMGKSVRVQYTVPIIFK